MPRSGSSSSLHWVATARWAERYHEVLDAAAICFSDCGYLGSSTKDIAARLGIRSASLYYYFPSKEAALAAICELGVKDFINNLRTVLAQPVPAAEKLRAAVANHLLPLRSRPAADYIRVFVRHRHHLPAGPRQTVARLALEYQSLVEEIFTDGVESGEFRANLDPKLATLAMLGLCNSVISARVLPRVYSVDDFIEEYSLIVTRGIVSGRSQEKAKR
jgi:TetR/AcrR family transcriptional regulator, cholesterol catabolism regulator